MTIPTNYTNLVAAIQEELEDTGTEFVSNIPTAIRLAEDRINRDVDGLFNKYITNVAVPSGNRTLLKPTGHKLSYNVHYLLNGQYVPLIKKSEDYILDYWPNTNLSGAPKYYADTSKTEIALAPPPSVNVTVVFSYAKNNDYLSATNLTNPIIDFYGDLLYKAALREQAMFARMPEAGAVYEQDYQTRLQLVSEETRRERQDNTAPRYRPEIDENRKQETTK